jgi:hypothetical protein
VKQNISGTTSNLLHGNMRASLTRKINSRFVFTPGTYEGEFDQNVRQGHGKCSYRNGNEFDGQVCACVCVCERERDRVRESERESVCVQEDVHIATAMGLMCVCVCVCERASERERERESDKINGNEFT